MERYARLVMCTVLIFIGFMHTAFAQNFELPMMSGTAMYVTQGNGGSYSHQGTLYYAWDWTFEDTNICQIPVIAPTSGVVIETYNDCDESDACGGSSSSCGHGFGNYVMIAYSGGYRMLGHLHDVYVTEGEYVFEGQVIGLVGSTGYSTEAHIHDQSQSSSTIGGQSVQSTYDYLDHNSYAPLIHEESTSTNSAVFDDRDSTSLTATNPYANTSNWLGNAESEGVHWWGGYYYDESNAPDSLSDGYAQTVYVQDYDGAYCSSGSSYGSGANDGAIVYDALGGARSAYVVQCQQWQTWVSEDAPTVGPESWLGNPVTNVYKAGYSNYYQLFQHGFIRVNVNGSVTTKVYANGYAPGEMEDHTWNPSLSYRFAEAYELRGAHKKLGMPLSGVEQVNSNYYVQRFPGQKPRSDDDRYLLYGVSQQSIVKITLTQYNTLVTTTTLSATSDVDDSAMDALDLDADGYTPDEGDCDDASRHVHPDHDELLNDDVDNDCDDYIDEVNVASATGNAAVPNTNWSLFWTYAGLTTYDYEPFQGYSSGTAIPSGWDFDQFVLGLQAGYGMQYSWGDYACILANSTQQTSVSFTFPYLITAVGPVTYNLEQAATACGYYSGQPVGDCFTLQTDTNTLTLQGLQFETPIDQLIITSSVTDDNFCFDTVWLERDADGDGLGETLDRDDSVSTRTSAENQYLFIDSNGDGMQDPCVRRNAILMCDEDLDGTSDYAFSYGDGVSATYFSTGDGVAVVFNYGIFYLDTDADGLTNSTMSFGVSGDQGHYFGNHGAFAIQRSTRYFLIDNNSDGLEEWYYPFGWGLSNQHYYLADMNGDGETDLTFREGNLFTVDQTHEGGDDFYFTYGWGDADDYYFADLTGDGKDEVMVRRDSTFYVLNNTSIPRTCSTCSNSHNWSFSYGNGL